MIQIDAYNVCLGDVLTYLAMNATRSQDDTDT